MGKIKSNISHPITLLSSQKRHAIKITVVYGYQDAKDLRRAELHLFADSLIFTEGIVDWVKTPNFCKKQRESSENTFIVLKISGHFRNFQWRS